jgi:hypothetical protein
MNKVDEAIAKVNSLGSLSGPIDYVFKNYVHLSLVPSANEGTIRIRHIWSCIQTEDVIASAMGVLIATADEFGVSVEAKPQSYVRDITMEALDKWWQSFGFENKGEWMVRQAKEKE